MREKMSTIQAELLEKHRQNGVVEVRKLPVGTRVALDTPDEHYELEVGTPEFGVVLVASDGRFENRDKVVVTGSIDPETNIFVPEIIGEGMRIVLRRQNKPVVRTGPVVAACIRGKGDSYEYRLWED